MNTIIKIITSFLLLANILSSQIKRDSIIKIIQQVRSNTFNFDKQYPLLQKALNASIQQKDTYLIILSYQRLADILWYKSIYGKSEDYYFKSLELIDSAKYPNEYAYALYAIGWIECIQKNRTEKISLLKRAFKVSVLLKDTATMATFANAISGAYMNFYHKDTTKKFYIDSAIYQLLYITNKLRAKNRYMFQIYANLAREYYTKNDFNNALSYIDTALVSPFIKKDTISYITSILMKTKILHKLNYKDSTIFLLKNFFNIYEQYGDNETLKEIYQLLYEIEKDKKNYSKALEYHEKYHLIDKKINDELLSVKYEEMEANKELFKKEQSILALQKQAEIQQIKNQQKTYIIVIALILMIVIIFFFTKSIRQTNQIKKLHEDVLQQKSIVEQKNRDILDSINYASRIQKALITSEEYIQRHFVAENYFNEYFILYLPKDIVSGDFYWANVNLLNQNIPHYIAVCDSTGHGVPGAFMSLLNINYLTEAVQEKQLYFPNDILNYVRNKLVQNLTYDEQQKDGMDASLIMFDESFRQTYKIFYTLANHQILILRKDSQPILLSGDKMPVGLSYQQKEFTLHSFTLQKGDWIYLYTDGYKDQFGGEKGKRILHKKFLNILLEIYQLNPEQQKSHLYNFLSEWKKGYEQTDDITILGIKI